MKNLIMAIFVTLSYGSVYAQSTLKTSADEVATPALAEKREAQKQSVISNYLSLKKSLVVSDSLQASKSAENLAAALDQFKFKKLSLEEMNEATSIREKMKDLARNIAQTKSINKQRAAMGVLSEQMWYIIERLKPDKMVLYKQTCTMTGKVWVSSEKEIMNPYFPKNMLHCGEVTAVVGEENVN